MQDVIQLGLSRIKALLGHLASPHSKVPIVHVAGTNGKGSVCAYLDSIFRQSGLSTGRFNSPHLVEPRDSICLNGRPVSLEAFSKAQSIVREADKKHSIGASSFELLTATAFHLFAHAIPPLQLAVIEVGMGGATDATNVCDDPLLTVITPVELDHQAMLGNTVEEIAAVKGGIIKTGRPCVMSVQPHKGASTVLRAIAQSRHSELVEAVHSSSAIGIPYRDVNGSVQVLEARSALLGGYQTSNASTALTAADLLSKQQDCLSRVPQLARITQETMRAGIEATRWPGRLEWVKLDAPSGMLDVLLDGAHNASSAVELRRYLDSLPSPTSTCFIVAVSSPRDPSVLLEPLLSDSSTRTTVIGTGFSQPEGMSWVRSQASGQLQRTASPARWR
ncbi:uncharacterized protein L969DRAFT_42247 [Mixia osmundae IAM 14324]|uniref:Mur ligase central domain-containing protein n=1 Tax=Mixia osmundae (strain CBS 9802 / IAM 14324 / JCM 22182 / KY 12970) TaxID=764103 RepID=G7E3U8_MIXOS|nr:uncharacterized protein L969DRAFT_42247 [Mixia osmundae IAM 14324]KEI41953.1 hypothetical protein L969DRAFT_42247 [Mixia osmundae IAM 14324]GAA97508.1 hypothetical protein E5Q_04186 [Mixia osmundae IAM 14324]